MKLVFMKILTIVGVILLNFAIAYAEEALKYEVTQDKVNQVCVYEIKNGLYQVVVGLNRPEKKAFSQLTENNIGKKLDVIVKGRILMSAVIEGKIDSGVISLGACNLEEAVKRIKEILKAPYIKNGVDKP